MDLCTRSLPRSAFTSLRDEATVDLDRDDGGLWSSRAPSAPSAWHGVEEPARLPEALRCLPDKAARGPKVSLRRGRASLPAKPDDAPEAPSVTMPKSATRKRMPGTTSRQTGDAPCAPTTRCM